MVQWKSKKNQETRDNIHIKILGGVVAKLGCSTPVHYTRLYGSVTIFYRKLHGE